ncbi:hypothetical protein PTTG_26325 [Puccinia triticina 1-1 BBBD Race 1]|uniref:Uncharacterized protein n=1 Tax=Puccinia triticina (isolate 1-1 / race 1 (BBBD)) TaxID=630390 RepID=A0A180GUT2_PUCT1|nr:hypothetical protein PTTG_26325 [Puccinia triticina 1-1 BBBD Race 1]
MSGDDRAFDSEDQKDDQELVIYLCGLTGKVRYCRQLLGLDFWRVHSCEADPARKKHEAPKPYKAPVVPPSAARKPVKKSTARAPNLNSKPTSAAPKVRFERGISKDHPNAVKGVLKKISGLKVPDLSVSELLAVAPSVAEGMKRWVSRKRVEVGAEELKVSSGTLAEGVDFKACGFETRLYSCPLGYLPCLVGDEESTASPLVDSELNQASLEESPAGDMSGAAL